MLLVHLLHHFLHHIHAFLHVLHHRPATGTHLPFPHLALLHLTGAHLPLIHRGRTLAARGLRASADTVACHAAHHTVHALHLVANDTAEASVLSRLASRLDRARAAGLAVDHILGRLSRDRLAEAALTNDPTTLDPFLRPDRRQAPGGVVSPQGHGSARLLAPPSAADLGDARQAAAREVNRLRSVRALTGGRDHVASSRAARASLRSTARRARVTCWCTALPRTGAPAGLVVVCLVHLEDDNGLPVARRPHAWLVESARLSRWLASGRTRRVRAALEVLASTLSERIRTSNEICAQDRSSHQAFITRAGAREAMLHDRLCRPANAPVQPGLFDRRELRQVASERRLIDALIHDSERRLDRLERARSVTGVDVDVTLVGTLSGRGRASASRGRADR